MSVRDYDKDRVHAIDFAEALIKAQNGWVIARQGWGVTHQFVFRAESGAFDAKDLTTGVLEPFLVIRMASGLHYVWMPTPADIAADDWAAMTRQEVSRRLPPVDSAVPADPKSFEVEWREL